MAGEDAEIVAQGLGAAGYVGAVQQLEEAVEAAWKLVGGRRRAISRDACRVPLEAIHDQLLEGRREADLFSGMRSEALTSAGVGVDGRSEYVQKHGGCLMEVLGRCASMVGDCLGMITTAGYDHESPPNPLYEW